MTCTVQRGVLMVFSVIACRWTRSGEIAMPSRPAGQIVLRDAPKDSLCQRGMVERSRLLARATTAVEG
jgi:hypothetical protein